MDEDDTTSKKNKSSDTRDIQSYFPSSSSSSTSTTTNSTSTESDQNKTEKLEKPTLIDAETFTTKSLGSETSTTTNTSSESLTKFKEAAAKQSPIYTSTASISKPSETFFKDTAAVAEEEESPPSLITEEPLKSSTANSQPEQDSQKPQKTPKTKIKFQTTPEELSRSDLNTDEESDEEDKRQSQDSQKEKGYGRDMLKASKSQHAKIRDDDDDLYSDSDDSFGDDTNLQMGHVFVYMVMPPDGGYGWIIMLMSFLCQVVVDGIMFTIGIVLPYIANDLNIPASQVVLVASMQIGFYFLSGTVSSAFINKYGFRPVALIGCTLAITVLSIATFSTNLTMMIFFYSILGGPSLSMVWVSSQLIIGYYFDKFRPIANGLSCSGAGAGIMIFSYMNSVLVPILGWRNLMRVHVCFLLLVLLMTLTFIEVTPTRIGRVQEQILSESDSESSGTSTELTKYTRFSLGVDSEEYPLDESFTPILERRSTIENKKPNCCTQCLNKCCPAYQRWIEKQRAKEAEEEAIRKYVIRQDLIERDDLFYMGPKDHQRESEIVDQVLKQRNAERASLGEEYTARRTITLDEFKSIHQKKSVINTLSTMQMKKDDDQLKQAQKSYAQLKQTTRYPLLAFLSPKNLVHPKIRRAFSLLFDFRLLAVMEFRILLLSAFLFPMGFNIPFVYSTVRVKIDKSLARLITPTIGFSNFAFRIASGFIAFKFREYTTYICGGGMVFGGLAVLTSAFYGIDVVWFQFVYAICYGIAPAFYSTLRAIIYVRALGLDKLTNAFGLTALAMGMGVFIGTTAGGILNDLTGSYSASFIFAGICICTAGGLKLLLPFLVTSK